MAERRCENCVRWIPRQVHDGTGECLAPWAMGCATPRPRRVLTLADDGCEAFEADPAMVVEKEGGERG